MTSAMRSLPTTKNIPGSAKPFCFSVRALLQLMLMLITALLLQLNDCEAVTEVPLRRHLSTAESKAHQFSVEQKMALQQVIRTMMGFGRDVPPVGLRGQPDGVHPTSVGGGGQTVPRYMHRLYEKYRVAEAVGMPYEMADTVRNINADLAIVNNGTLFVFNLNSLLEAETVLRAEIHIYKRRLRVSSSSGESSTVEPPQPSAEPDFIVVKVYELGPRILRERASFRLPDAGHSGWHTFDVTSALKACSSTQRSGATPRMLALSFSFDDDDDDADSGSRSSAGKLLLSKFVRKLSRPFLMVFSQENQNSSLDAQLDSLFRRGDDRPIDRSPVEEDSWRWDYDNPLLSHGRFLVGRKNKPAFRSRVMWSSPSEVRGPRRQNLSDEIFVMESFAGPREVSSDLGWNATGRSLQKYAVEEEAIGGLVRGRFYHAGFTPDAAENVPAKSLSYQRRKRQVVADNEIPQEVTFAEPEPVPPVFYNLPKTNPGILRGRSRTGRKDQPSTPRPAIEFGVEEKAEEKPRRRGKGRAGEGESVSVLMPRPQRGRKRSGAREGCGRRKLVVDFGDIGWSEWIISPKSFEAHYCDGLCAYPMDPKSRPTNHATIQSIVKAIGLQAEVPSPCCIPASLSSVTLLYFDQNQNVVLKNYPDMTVRSCACR